MEVTEDQWAPGVRPRLDYEDLASDFYGLTAIQYQGEIIQWLQREYGEDVEVKY